MARVQRDVARRIQLPLEPERYRFLCQVGVSERSVVYKAVCESMDSLIVAVKVIDVDNSRTKIDEFFVMEANALSLLNHPNFLSPYCCFLVDGKLWVVMPFMPVGPLQSVVSVRFTAGVPEQFLAIILKQILGGLVYLHELVRVHKDLKASNIFVDSNGIIKITDLGVSASVFGSQSDGKSSVPYWLAPEVVASEEAYSSATDIWSFGILALELAYGCPPLSDSKTLKSLLRMILRRFQYSPDIENIMNNNVMERRFSSDFKHLVASCLVKDPSLRPSAESLLQNPFITNSSGPNPLYSCIARDIVGIEDRFGEHKDYIMSLMENGDEDHDGGNQSSKNVKISGWEFNFFIFELEPNEESSGRRVRFSGETIIPPAAGEAGKAQGDSSESSESADLNGGGQRQGMSREQIVDALNAMLRRVDQQREMIESLIGAVRAFEIQEEAYINEIRRLQEELAAERERAFDFELEVERLKLQIPSSSEGNGSSARTSDTSSERRD